MFWTFYLSFPLLLATFSRAQSTLTLTQGSASDVANSLFGQSYNLGPVSSAGMAEQIGTFSGGNAAGFGIDSGIVLSSGSLTGVSDNEQGSSDPDISGSLDAASISTTITAKDSNTHALTTFGAIFCTCENANSADSYPERARVVLDGAIVYDKSKGPEDTRPTTPFGFAVGNNVAFGGGPCKCSNADTFTLARTTTATTVKVVIADIGDRSFNSWIFMGFTGFADEVDITQTVTSTISVPVTSTVTATTSTETDVVTFSQTNTLTTTTTLLPATVTTTAATSTTTVVNPICTNYILQFEAACCPRSVCHKAPKKLVARQQASTTITSTVSTTTISETDTYTETSTVDVAFTTSTTTTELFTGSATSVVTPTAITSTIKPVATATICKQVIVPKFFCPKGVKAQSLISAAEKNFLNLYAKKIKPGWPSLEVHCDADPQKYQYP